MSYMNSLNQVMADYKVPLEMENIVVKYKKCEVCGFTPVIEIGKIVVWCPHCEVIKEI